MINSKFPYLYEFYVNANGDDLAIQGLAKTALDHPELYEPEVSRSYREFIGANVQELAKAFNTLDREGFEKVVEDLAETDSELEA